VNARVVALVSLFTALGIAVRLAKHALVGTLQFLNAPLLAAMVAGYTAGPLAGMLTGILSFALSDLLLGLGPWTVVDSLLAGAIGGAWGLLRAKHRATLIFVLAFISEFMYDVLSSYFLLLMFVRDPVTALIYSLLGLYLPVMGGYMIGVGPLTEAVTAGLTAALISRVDRLGIRG